MLKIAMNQPFMFKECDTNFPSKEIEVQASLKVLPTPTRATTDEIASARWCHALAFISPLPSFSPALFVIQYSL